VVVFPRFAHAILLAEEKCLFKTSTFSQSPSKRLLKLLILRHAQHTVTWFRAGDLPPPALRPVPPRASFLTQPQQRGVSAPRSRPPPPVPRAQSAMPARTARTPAEKVGGVSRHQVRQKDKNSSFSPFLSSPGCSPPRPGPPPPGRKAPDQPRARVGLPTRRCPLRGRTHHHLLEDAL